MTEDEIAEQKSLRGSQFDPAVFVKISLNEPEPEEGEEPLGPIRIWSGVGPRRGGPILDVETGELETEARFLSGRLLSTPEMVQLQNGQSHRMELALNSIFPDIKALLGARAPEAHRAEVQIAWAKFKGEAPDPDVTYPMWRAYYEVESVGSGYVRTKGGLMAPVILLPIVDAFILRHKPEDALWSHDDQTARYPGDLGMSRLTALHEGRTRVFKPGPD